MLPAPATNTSPFSPNPTFETAVPKCTLVTCYRVFGSIMAIPYIMDDQMYPSSATWNPSESIISISSDIF